MDFGCSLGTFGIEYKKQGVFGADPLRGRLKKIKDSAKTGLSRGSKAIGDNNLLGNAM